MTSGISHASQYPLADSIIATINQSNTELNFDLSPVDVGSAGDRKLNTFGYAGLTIALGFTQMDRNTGQFIFLHGRCNKKYTSPSEQGSVTVSEAGMQIYKSCGFKYFSYKTVPDEEIGCVGVGIYNSDIEHPNVGEVYFPQGLCMSIPPVDQTCEIRNSIVTFDHGTLNVNNEKGQFDIKDDELSVYCTAPTLLNVNFMQNTLVLAPGVISELSIPGGNENQLPRGNSVIPIKSTLSIEASAKPGEFETNTVVFIEYL